MFGDTIDNNTELANAYKVISAHLADNNAHALLKLLSWEMEGETDKATDEVMYRAYLVLKNFLEGFGVAK